ncbi:hypothetical protein MKK63_10540 [Methylobacterium sp. J-088]|uniref:hypothetical protein n=1 Tax=Methylobacterium sp. J-088 TaxID=2836664 RepID=UPI001FB9331F|nr:hypothetical protein [Methylobacterium sp. J-088]MCJ2063146.1 hypothetical protein [Methylobacterium sp. J-088]
MADGPRSALPPHKRNFTESRLAKARVAFASFIEVVRRTNDRVHGSTDLATSSRMHSTRAPRAPTPHLGTVQT